VRPTLKRPLCLQIEAFLSPVGYNVPTILCQTMVLSARAWGKSLKPSPAQAPAVGPSIWSAKDLSRSDLVVAYVPLETLGTPCASHYSAAPSYIWNVLFSPHPRQKVSPPAQPYGRCGSAILPTSGGDIMYLFNRCFSPQLCLDVVKLKYRNK
jgi:hypothetical protein